MKYLTADEIKKLEKDGGREIVENCAGKSVRDLFAIKVFENSYQKFFSDKHKNILDLGPASGAFISQINQAGYKNFYGVDIDNYLKPENKTLFKEFKTADLSWDKIPWPDGFFQVVTAWCVLPHLENPFNCLREVHRILDKGGMFIFTAPHLTSKPSMDYFTSHEDFGSYRGGNNHLVLFTKGIMEKAVLKYFDLVNTEYHVRPKIFQGSVRGKIYQLIYKIAGKLSPKLVKALEKRWAYNAVYVLKKKDVA